MSKFYSMLVFSAMLTVPLSACQNRHESTRSTSQVSSEMVRLVEQRRYDDAVKIGLSAISGEPHDAVLYRSIAATYTVRARNEPGNREEWLRSAVDFADRSLEAIPGDPMNTATVAQVLEQIGDLSEANKCCLYERAQSLWAKAATEAQESPTVTTRGEVVSTKPVRESAEPEILRLESKRKDNKCPEIDRP